MAEQTHKVATDALETLGTCPIPDNSGRDAIHLAVEPAVAGVAMRGGERIKGARRGSPAMNAKPRLITVCAACLTASCWQGEFYCDDYKTAGTVEKTVEELKALGLEHPDHWVEVPS